MTILYGGQEAGTLRLASGEYINPVAIRHGFYVNQLEFRTNLGETLSAGSGGSSQTSLSNVREFTIGSRSGKYPGRIELTYCHLR